MNAKKLPVILAYAEKPRATFDRAKLARWAAGWLALALYVGAWWYVWNPFTWFISGLMGFATLATWLQERNSGNPENLPLALFTVWALLPFQLAVIFWLLEVMQ